MIKSIESGTMYFEVGYMGTVSIELTNHGNEKLNIYKVTNDKKEYVFIGIAKGEEKIDYGEKEQVQD